MRPFFVLMSCLKLLESQITLSCADLWVIPLLMHILCAYIFAGLISLTVASVQCGLVPSIDPRSYVNIHACDSHS